jgi:hypothetical protein
MEGKNSKMKQPQFSEQVGRTWLICNYDGQEIKYAHPPIRGTHQGCYQTIHRDLQLKPADGLDLALLVNGAFTRETDQWADVRNNVDYYLRIPRRVLWMPKGHEFHGAFVEKDFKGEGLSTKIQVPESINKWEEKNGIYVHPNGNLVFAPRESYEFGDHTSDSFVKDGIALGLLDSPESAEIFAKTAIDNKITPKTWGVGVEKKKNPEQRVATLGSYDDRLFVSGNYWDGYDDGYAFGVLNSGYVSARKN